MYSSTKNHLEENKFSLILESIKLTPMYREMYAEILIELQKRKFSSYEDETLKKHIYDVLCKRTIYSKIRNKVLDLICHNSGEKPWKNDDAVTKLQARWLRRAQKGLQNMCTDLGLPTSTHRVLSERVKIEQKWYELGTADELDTKHLRPVYSSKDMLDFLKTAVDAQSLGISSRRDSQPKSWQALGNVPYTPQSKHLQSISKELKNSECDQDTNLAEKVLLYGDSVVAQNFCRKGCPTDYREKIWQLALQSEPDQKDVKETASNDDGYFVFEDLLYQLLLIFFRKQLTADTVKSDTLLIRKHVLPMKNLDPNSSPEGAQSPAVIPFFGFSYHAAPLCYVTNGPVRCLKMFSKIYEKHFRKLHMIINDSQGILCLTKLFEDLLAKERHLSDHFEKYQLNPTNLVFKWIMRAFSGHLNSEEVLILWDRIIGFSDLSLLSVLAVGIFVFLESEVFHAKNQEDLIKTFYDMSQLSVIKIFKEYKPANL